MKFSGGEGLEVLSKLGGAVYAKAHARVNVVILLLMLTGIDLLERMLLLDPDVRITAEQSLAHPFFELLSDPDDEPVSKPFIDLKDKNSKDVEVWRSKIISLNLSKQLKHMKLV